jgi:hypothetical protein
VEALADEEDVESVYKFVDSEKAIGHTRRFRVV